MLSRNRVPPNDVSQRRKRRMQKWSAVEGLFNLEAPPLERRRALNDGDGRVVADIVRNAHVGIEHAHFAEQAARQGKERVVKTAATAARCLTAPRVRLLQIDRGCGRQTSHLHCGLLPEQGSAI